MGKGKKYDYRLDEVQDEGNNLLRTTISSLRNSLSDVYWIGRSEEDQNDKGVDFQYELEDKLSGQTLHLFKIQNKGTESDLVPLKNTKHKGFISFQLKLRNAIYYRYELPLSLIFTISDIKANKVYWHPIQLDLLSIHQFWNYRITCDTAVDIGHHYPFLST